MSVAVIVVATCIIILHVVVMRVVVRLVRGGVARLEGVTGLADQLQAAVLQQVLVHVLGLRQKWNADDLAWHR